MFRHTERLSSWLPVLRIVALGCGIALCAALIFAGPSAAGNTAPPALGHAAPPPQCAAAAPPRLTTGLDSPSGARAARPANVLYDQYGSGMTGVSSQQFEPAYAAYDAQAADDFVVPAGQTWTVNEVEAGGGYYGGPGPVEAVNVFFYGTTGGPYSPLPGTPVFTQTGILYTPSAGAGDLIIPLSPPAQLAAGTYWVSVQARMDLTTQGQWYWRDIGSFSTQGASAAWRNPAFGYGRCPDWAERYNCEGNFVSHDQSFRLSGAVNGTPLPTLSAIPTWTPAASPTAGGTPVLPCPILTQPALLPTATPAPACGLFWREPPGANMGTGTNYLFGVAAIAPDDVWAVGFYSDGSGPSHTLTEHWNGTTWGVVASPNVLPGANTLVAVSARAANDVWAAGYTSGGFSTRTLIEHWDGATWSVVASPNIGPYNNSLQAIKALAPNDIWAVGYYNTDAAYASAQALTLHWDGAHWHIVPTPSGSLMESYLLGVDASGPDDAWAVGYGSDSSYRQQSVTFHWDGTSWSRIPSPNTTSQVNTLKAVAVLAPNDAWVIGVYHDYSHFYHPMWEHWDGTQWTLLPYSLQYGSPNTYLVGLAAAGPNDIWAAGSYIDDHNMGHTLIEHWDGQFWTSVPSPDHAPLNTGLSAIALAGPGDVWAAGAYFASCVRTVVLHYSDPCVTPPSPTVTPPNVATATLTATPPPTRSPVPPSRTVTAGPSPTPCFVSFGDVQSNDYFYLPVQYLACHGAISGYSDATFRPYNPTTRSQTVKIVTLAFGIADYTPSAGNYTFADVPPTFPFFSYIETAAHAQMISGYTCGGPREPCDALLRPYFRPYASVTRGQVAKLVVGAAGWALVDPPDGAFVDVLPGTAFYPFVETAYCHAALAGYSCGGAGEPCDAHNRLYFRQNNPATRGQIATIAYGALYGSPDCLRLR
jgi:hypothetical protein